VDGRLAPGQKFAIVTGVSAGALSHTLAFWGPAIVLRSPKRSPKGVSISRRNWGAVFSLLGSPDISRFVCFVDLVDRFVRTPDFWAAIAAETLVAAGFSFVTTNLDAQSGVVGIWALYASSGLRMRRELFRMCLSRRQSYPRRLRSPYIESRRTARFREMHVDGGATTQVFILPDVSSRTGMKHR